MSTCLLAMQTDTFMYLTQKEATLMLLLSENRVNMRIIQMFLVKDNFSFTFDATLKLLSWTVH